MQGGELDFLQVRKLEKLNLSSFLYVATLCMHKTKLKYQRHLDRAAVVTYISSFVIGTDLKVEVRHLGKYNYHSARRQLA